MVRILVVDDHDGMRHSLSWILSSEDDFTICGEAADGVQAVEQARYLIPDVIVMDVSMPNMDGLTAARIIHRETPSAHIVLISLKAPSILKEISSRNGLTFIDKAKLSGELISAVRNMTK